MNRQRKELTVKQFKDRFMQEQSVFAVNFTGVSVVQLDDLRARLRESEGELKVAKTRLVKLAADSIPLMKVFVPYCNGQTAFVFSSGDPVAVAKVLKSFAKEVEGFGVEVAYFDSELFSSEKVSLIADLPSKDELLAKLCGLMNGPLMNFMKIQNLLVAKFLRALNEISKSKEASS